MLGRGRRRSRRGQRVGKKGSVQGSYHGGAVPGESRKGEWGRRLPRRSKVVKKELPDHLRKPSIGVVPISGITARS